MSHLGRAFLAPGTLSTPAGASIQAPCGRTDRTDRTGRTAGQSGGAFQSAMAGAVAASALVALQKLGLRSSSGVQRRAFSAAKSLRHQPLKQRASLTGRMAATVLAPPGELLGVAPDEKYNVPAGVREKLGKDLLLNPKHPLGILWRTVQDYFAEQDPNCKFFDTEKPVVNTVDCFDKLRVPPEHPSRSPSDTYYVNKDYVLRTHTSAHQCQFLSQYPKITSFLCAGDVYRRDEIDASHYPAFHQCEGVRLFDAEKVSREEVLEDLKKTLEGLAAHLFQLKTGEDTMRWLDEYFPFTEPSLELEIFYQDDWMEVLGCGVIHHDVLRNAGLDPAKVHGWAFGLGLERLAMVLFGIPDIRLFWSEDPRFSEQFAPESFAEKTRFKPFSKYPPVLKDISMWIPENFADNDLFEMIRDEGGDQVEKVDLMDDFTHPKTGKRSKMFRVTWRDMSRTLTNEEVNAKHETVLERLVKELEVELR
mmetsp:Transcript_41890/g.99736  ORF Transcript_41890/g.99736 Transcript_41890/m.99736 type:complete len:477 (-) Transcript_41890:129-1559(-)|eukprot:CAMPEP_0181445968 /NCGR_PEP_ID=MMETSP1110-20121109/25862_1 /TAXON_ID=174948 /ORGANISM="Symbiodinium sp., Strain CCMP421" /LENGTH=476 /DNA_ID=CAMNT_0023570031 /DNA_START=47 /DNA_END=1477 /DNA_ORIENTATION=-